MTGPGETTRSGEIEIIGDGEGIAVFGEASAVERFFRSAGLLAESVPLDARHAARILGSVGEVMGIASRAIENSGRYLKLTKESAQWAKELGLTPTKTPGISHAMLGNPGKISKWLQVESGPKSLVATPALLSAIGGIMTQLARQAEAQELKTLLVALDSKLDDVRRAQRDDKLARMDRVISVIGEAMALRESGGHNATLWGKLEGEAGTIAEVQASALRSLNALADKVEGERKVGELARATKQIEHDVTVWLAVLAKCFQLQDEFAVLELDHVREVAPDALDGHRLGLASAQRDRRDVVLKTTQTLIERMDAAGAIAVSNTVFHSGTVHAVIDSLNTTAHTVNEFASPLGIEPGRDPLAATPWREALRDPQQLRNAGAEAGRVALTGLGIAAATVASVAVTRQVTKRDD